MNTYLRRFIFDSYCDKSLPDIIGEVSPIASDSATMAHKISLAQAPQLLPDLISVIEGVVVQADDYPKIRAYAGGLLSYVYNPLDLISDQPPTGYVDDAIVCALGLMKLADEGTVQLDPLAVELVRRIAGLADYLRPDLLSAITEFVNNLEEKIVLIV